MNDRDALLAAVFADPADDLPRLVYADWLDDYGDPDRAEFIRVQCDIAHRERWFAGHVRLALLKRREEELLTSHWRLWADAIRYDVRCEGAGPCDVQSGSATTTISFERGFIHTVHTALAAFYGWEERCGDHCGLGMMDPETGSSDCLRCDDTGWIFHGGFARELFRQHPVATLSLTDVRPADDDGLFGFRSRHRGEPEQVELGEVTEDSVDEYSDLPLRLWKLLGEDDDPRQDRTGLVSGWKLFRTHDRATERLALAILSLGREMAS